MPQILPVSGKVRKCAVISSGDESLTDISTYQEYGHVCVRGENKCHVPVDFMT